MATIQIDTRHNTTIPFKAYQGDTCQFDLICKDGDVEADLTGVSVRMQIRDELGAKLFEFTMGSGVTIAGGTVSFRKILACVPGSHFYDIEFTFANGDVFTYLDGPATIYIEKTKSP